MKPHCQASLIFATSRGTEAQRRAIDGFTGQDWEAFRALAHLVQLWVLADHDGRRAAEVALRATLGAMQPRSRESVRALVLWAVPEDQQPALESVLRADSGDTESRILAIIGFRGEGERLTLAGVTRQAELEEVDPFVVAGVVQKLLEAGKVEKGPTGGLCRFPRKFLGGGVEVDAWIDGQWQSCTVAQHGWDEQAGTVKVELEKKPCGPTQIVRVHPDFLRV